MSRLVVVSNRVADPRKVAAGGLAVILALVLFTTVFPWAEDSLPFLKVTVDQ